MSCQSLVATKTLSTETQYLYPLTVLSVYFLSSLNWAFIWENILVEDWKNFLITVWLYSLTLSLLMWVWSLVQLLLGDVMIKYRQQMLSSQRFVPGFYLNFKQNIDQTYCYSSAPPVSSLSGNIDNLQTMVLLIRSDWVLFTLSWIIRGQIMLAKYSLYNLVVALELN